MAKDDLYQGMYRWAAASIRKCSESMRVRDSWADLSVGQRENAESRSAPHPGCSSASDALSPSSHRISDSFDPPTSVTNANHSHDLICWGLLWNLTREFEPGKAGLQDAYC